MFEWFAMNQPWQPGQRRINPQQQQHQQQQHQQEQPAGNCLQTILCKNFSLCVLFSFFAFLVSGGMGLGAGMSLGLVGGIYTLFNKVKTTFSCLSIFSLFFMFILKGNSKRCDSYDWKNGV